MSVALAAAAFAALLSSCGTQSQSVLPAATTSNGSLAPSADGARIAAASDVASQTAASLAVVQDNATLPCANSTEAATFTCTLPANTTPGDTLVAAVQVHNDSGQTITPPAGFTAVTSRTDGIYSLLQVFTAPVTSATKSFAFSLARPNYASASLIEVSGASAARPIAMSATSEGGPKTIATSTLYPSTSGLLPLAFYGEPSGNEYFIAQSGWTTRSNNGSAPHETSESQSLPVTTTTAAISGSVSYTNSGNGLSALVLVAPNASATASPSPSPTPSGPANSQWADAFVNAIGVDVHFSYTNTAYKYLTSPAPSGNSIVSSLRALGVRHLRDGAIENNTGLCPAYRSVIANGTDVDDISSTSTNATAMKTIVSCLGSGLFALEAPNELDLSGNSGWPQADVSEMQTLSAARGSAFPSTVKLFGPSATSEQAYKSLAAVDGDAVKNYLDYANSHIYFDAREPETPGWGGNDGYGSYGAITTTRNWAVEIAAPGKPWVATETGYPDASSDAGYVAPAIKSKYIVRDMLRHWQDGAQYIYVYELATEAGSWGLMDSNLYAKPAYTALRNLIAILKDPGATVAPGYLNYALNASSDVEHLLFKKRDGSYWLCLWQHDEGWNPNASTPISVPSTTASISFGSVPAVLQRYQINPSDGSVAVTKFSSQGSITTTVTDSPQIIQIGSTVNAPVLAAGTP